MSRSTPSLKPHLLTRSDLASLEIPATTVFTWVGDGSLEEVCTLPTDDDAGEPVFTVHRDDLRLDLHERLATIGKPAVVLTPFGVRAFLLRAMSRADETAAVGADAEAEVSASPDNIDADAGMDRVDLGLAEMIDGADDAVPLDVDAMLQLAEELAATETGTNSERDPSMLIDAEAGASAGSAVDEHIDAAPRDPTRATSDAPNGSNESGGFEAADDRGGFVDFDDDGEAAGEIADDGDDAVFDFDALAEEFDSPGEQPARHQSEHEHGSQDTFPFAADATASRYDTSAGSELPTDEVAISTAPDHSADGSTESVAPSVVENLGEVADGEDTVTGSGHDPEPDRETPAAAVAAAPATSSFEPPYPAEAAAVPATEALPTPMTAMDELLHADVPPRTTHDDPMSAFATAGPAAGAFATALPVADMTGTESFAEGARAGEPLASDARPADPFADEPPAAELPAAGPQAGESGSTDPFAADAPVIAATADDAFAMSAFEQESAASEAATATPALEPAAHELLEPRANELTSIDSMSSAPSDTAPPTVGTAQTATAPDHRVQQFLDAIEHALVEIAQRPSTTKIDIDPLVAVVQAGFERSAAQVTDTTAALSTLSEKLARFGDQVESGVVHTVQSVLERANASNPHAAAAKPLVSGPAPYVRSRANRSALVLGALGLLAVSWAFLFWIKTGSPRLAFAVLVAANAVGCLVLAQPGRS